LQSGVESRVDLESIGQLSTPNICQVLLIAQFRAAASRAASQEINYLTLFRCRKHDMTRISSGTAQDHVEESGREYFESVLTVNHTLTDTAHVALDVELPLDVIGIVAKHLIASDLYGTCALLNVACRAVRSPLGDTSHTSQNASVMGSKWNKVSGSSCWGEGPKILSPRQEDRRKQMVEEWGAMKHSAGLE
jgi:hypothetical protein